MEVEFSKNTEDLECGILSQWFYLIRRYNYQQGLK